MFSVFETLHDEHIIAVREEPNLHLEPYQGDVTDMKRSEWLNVELRNLAPKCLAPRCVPNRSVEYSSTRSYLVDCTGVVHWSALEEVRKL